MGAWLSTSANNNNGTEAMSLEQLDIDHIPASHKVYAALFRDVSNADFLHAQLLARNPEFDYAFIDASSVISRLQLLSAIYRALTVWTDGTLLTATPHAEVVLSMSPNNNVPPPSHSLCASPC